MGKHKFLCLLLVLLCSIRASAEPTGSTRQYLAIGYGWGALRYSGSTNRGTPLVLHGGYRVHCQLHLFFELDAVTAVRDTTNSTRTIEQTSSLVGVRWGPELSVSHDGVYPEPTAVYLKVGIGIASLHASPNGALNPFDSDRLETGPVIGIAAGWLPIQGDDYALGFEAFERLTLFDTGKMHSFGLILLAQLRLR
jgi:hypothetical protein